MTEGLYQEVRTAARWAANKYYRGRWTYLTADDLEQEMHLKLLDMDPTDVTRPVLYTVAKQTAIDFGRRKPPVPTDGKALEKAQLRTRSAEASYLESFSMAQVEAYMLALVAQLTDRRRAVAELYYLHGMTQAQIGQQLGLATSTIKSHLSACRAALGALEQDLQLYRLYLHPDAVRKQHLAPVASERLRHLVG